MLQKGIRPGMIYVSWAMKKHIQTMNAGEMKMLRWLSQHPEGLIKRKG